MIRLFSDFFNYNGLISVAGTGFSGTSGENGFALNAQLDRPRGLGLDASKENLYIATSPINGGGRILKMNLSTRIVTRVAGDPTKGLLLTGTGIITSVTQNSSTVVYTLIQDSPSGAAATKHSLEANQNVRITGIPAPNASLNITGVIAGITNTTVTINRAGGPATPVTIDLSASPASIGTLAVNAGIVNPYNVVFDSTGNMYFGNQHFNSSCILKVDTDGYISRYCGNRGGDTVGNNVHRLNPSVRIGGPRGIAIDANNNIYFGDIDSGFTVRKIDATTNQLSIVVGSLGQKASFASPVVAYPVDGASGTTARLRAPTAMAFDSDYSNLYIFDLGSQTEYNSIYRYNIATNQIYIILQSFMGIRTDPGPARNAPINGARGIALDELNNIYISETDVAITKIDSNGIIVKTTEPQLYDIAWHLAIKSPTEIYVCTNTSNKVLVTGPVNTYR